MTGVVLAVAAGALVVGALAALLAAWWLRRTLVVVTVNGESMEPTFRHGERVLVRRTRINSVRPGQVVVVAPGRPQRLSRDYPFWMIKRLRAAPGDLVPREVPMLGEGPEPTVPAARMVVLGDNPSGSDSRQLGYFYTANLLGVVVRRLLPRSATAGNGDASTRVAWPHRPGEITDAVLTRSTTVDGHSDAFLAGHCEGQDPVG